MQEYDARGHPVNTESRILGKGLRRAKNDILSTMGIVVSREDRNTGSPNEQQKLDQIASENDFGLVITTLDQLLIFFGTWWTSSLTGRVQVIMPGLLSIRIGLTLSFRPINITLIQRY